MTRKRVITERDVRRAKSEGRTSIDVGDAVITPSAREVAAMLKMTMSSANAEPRPAPPSRIRTSTRQASTPRTRPAGQRREETPPRSTGGKGGPSPEPRAQTPSPKRKDESSGQASAGSSPAAPAAPTAPSSGKKVPIAIGADHGGVALKTAISAKLRELGHDVADVGTNSTDPVDYPDIAELVARMVGERRVAFGIMIDGAGIGSCMAANKVAGVRAAMCYDITTAANAREHNFANVLTLGGGLIGERLALAIVETFLSTPTGAERHAARVAKIDALDKRG